MKWNSRKEDTKFNNQQSRLKKQYLTAGMSEEQIAQIREYDHKLLLQKRNQAIHNFQEVPYQQILPDGTEYILEHPALQYEEDLCPKDPFQYGVSDKRLKKIIADADETDMEILRLLFKGVPQDKISALLGINQSTISRRIQKMQKKFSENA